MLTYPIYTNLFIVEVDASNNGLGAVDRALRGAERNMKKYSSRKWELLALKWPLSFTFIVLTDNNPLTNLQPKNKLRAVEQ